MSRLIDIDDERLWDILFDEACVEEKQAERIKTELEKCVAFDTEKVVEQLGKGAYMTTDLVCGGVFEAIRLSSAIDIVKKGGVE